MFTDSSGAGQRRAGGGPSFLLSSGAIRCTPVAADSVYESTTDELLKDIAVREQLGQGAFGHVYRGMYQGAEVAVKVMVVDSLDRTCLRETLLAPQLNHPHVIKTYTTRCATVTEEFLQDLHRRHPPPAIIPAGPAGPGPGVAPAAGPAMDGRALPNLPNFSSGDGMGPVKMQIESDRMWREVLTRLAAVPGKMVSISVQELAQRGALTRAIRNGIFRECPDPAPGSAAGARGWSLRVARRALLRTASEIACGMVHLHKAGVVHGDLKPANVLLVHSNEDVRGFVPKVCDFGLAHLLGQKSCVESCTMGTVCYMAPEHINSTVSKASDVYSFGMLLNEMMTGRRPYPNMHVGAVLVGVCAGELSPDWPEEEWPELCALGRRCISLQPAQRPTFQELVTELKAMENQLRAQSLHTRLSEETERMQQAQADSGTGSSLLLPRQQRQAASASPFSTSAAPEPTAAADAAPLRPGGPGRSAPTRTPLSSVAHLAG